MFPYLSDLTYYMFGFDFSFPLPMFGFMVAWAFVGANLCFVREMKRKEADGLLSAEMVKVMKGEKASIAELAGNGLFGFVLGFKILEIIVNYSEVIKDLPGFILSMDGNWIGGILGAGLMAFVKYRDAEKHRLPEPKEVEERVRPYQHVGTMTFIAAFGGILGAKIFDSVENLDRLFADPIGVIFSPSGLSIYGGLIIGGGSVVYYAYKKKLKLVHVIDSCAPGLMLAYGVGRIGCQLSGDGDWGLPNNLPMPEMLSFLPEWMWAFDYFGNINETDLGAPGRAVQILVNDVYYTYEGNAWPTAFYETVMAFTIFGILWGFRKKIKVPGYMFSFYLIFTGIERFFIEKVRINDSYNILGIEATQAEIISILVILAGIGGIWYARKVHKTSPGHSELE